MFILYITSKYSHYNILFSKPCQRQYELLPSLGVRHLSSVIRLLFTFKSSPLKTLSQMNWNLVGSIYGRFSLMSAHLVMIQHQTWPPQAILVSDWSISKKSTPLKLLSHMNRNLVGSIYMYGRFCVKFPQRRMKGEWHWASSNYVPIKTCIGNILFDQISACRIVFIYKILIAVIKFCESF
jgi:hypothetical protein